MSTTSAQTARSAAASRLERALESWNESGSSFVYHMSTMPERQDSSFSDALSLLDTVAHDVDESYRSWWDLERECDREKNYASQRAYIQQAIDLAAK